MVQENVIIYLEVNNLAVQLMIDYGNNYFIVSAEKTDWRK